MDLNIYLNSTVIFKPSKKKIGLRPFFRNFMVGREILIFIFYFEAEFLMLKYNKTYPYILLFLHRSVQAYYTVHKHHLGIQKT